MLACWLLGEVLFAESLRLKCNTVLKIKVVYVVASHNGMQGLVCDIHCQHRVVAYNIHGLCGKPPILLIN